MRGSILVLAAAVVAVAAGAGCLSTECRKQAVLNEVRCQRFVELMQRGRTTREQERDFILANERAWTALRAALGLEGALTEPAKESSGLVSTVVRLAFSFVPRVWVSLPILEPRIHVWPWDVKLSASEAPPSMSERSGGSDEDAVASAEAGGR